jgi:hypothetical protein
MSKHHTSSRRRSYGRRQHELHERIDRIRDIRRGERAWRDVHDRSLDALGYLDGQGSGQHFGFID